MGELQVSPGRARSRDVGDTVGPQGTQEAQAKRKEKLGTTCQLEPDWASNAPKILPLLTGWEASLLLPHPALVLLQGLCPECSTPPNLVPSLSLLFFLSSSI